MLMCPDGFVLGRHRMDYFPYLLAVFIAALAFFGWLAFRSDQLMRGNRKRIDENMDRQRESMNLQRESIGLQRESLSSERRLIALLEEQVQPLTELRERLPAADKHP